MESLRCLRSIGKNESFLAEFSSYYVKAQAKDEQGAISGWSNGHQVSISGEYPDTVVATIPVGNGPSGVVALPDGNYVYVTNYGDDNISVIRTSDNTIVGTVSVGSGPIGVAELPTGAHIYVTNEWSGNVSVIGRR